MDKNKLSIAINGRQYTMVSDESVEYLQKLADHVNEKITFVRKYSSNQMGERPVILAALNICDEFYKAEEAARTLKEQAERLNGKLLDLAEENRNLHDLFDNNEFEIDIKSLQAEVDTYKKTVEEQRDKIRHLENSLQALRFKGEKDIEALKRKYEN